MKPMSWLRTGTLLFLFFSSTVIPSRIRAEEETGALEAPRLRGRHELMVHAGLLHRTSTESSIAAGSVTNETRVNGFSGSFSYAYWAEEDWSVGLSSGAIDVQSSESVTGGTVTTESAVVVPILFGVTWAPAALAIGPALRPSLSLATGPYLGVATSKTVSSVIEEKTTVESTLGLRARVELNAMFGSRFLSGVTAGYHFVSAFDQPIGPDRDYSGPEFTLGFGILLGRAR